MVLSTLHTNDAPQTIARLMNMGIAPYNITSSVTLVIAQRLARRLCNNCKKPMELPAAALLAEGFTAGGNQCRLQVYEAVGCAGMHRRLQGPYRHLPGHADERRDRRQSSWKAAMPCRSPRLQKERAYGICASPP